MGGGLLIVSYIIFCLYLLPHPMMGSGLVCIWSNFGFCCSLDITSDGNELKRCLLFIVACFSHIGYTNGRGVRLGRIISKVHVPTVILIKNYGRGEGQCCVVLCCFPLDWHLCIGVE
jgi:hypothetical protein